MTQAIITGTGSPGLAEALKAAGYEVSEDVPKVFVLEAPPDIDPCQVIESTMARGYKAPYKSRRRKRRKW